MDKKNIESINYLSPMQQGILFHALQDGNGHAYCQQASCVFEGILDGDRFRQAWQQVVERHSSLRTLMVWENRDRPLQLTLKAVELPWRVLDWQVQVPASPDSTLAQLKADELNQRIALNCAPLMRWVLVRQPQQFTFIWTYHHLVLDGWSVAIVMREVMTIYTALLQQQPSYLPSTRPFYHYVNWVEQQDQDVALDFWRRSLQGLSAPTRLPIQRFDHYHSGSKLRQGWHSQPRQHYVISLAADTTRRLTTLVQTHNLTLNSLIQGIWALLLSRYTGETDVVFGSTVSGRSPLLKDVEFMVGLFINTIPVRVQVDEHQLFIPWLQELMLAQSEREQYSFSPLAEVQSLSALSGDTTLFDTLVVFENYPLDRQAQSSTQTEFRIKSVETVDQSTHPLNLVIVPGECLKVDMSYRTERFSAEGITRLSKHLQIILEAVATYASPSGVEASTMDQVRLQDLPWLTPGEQQQILLDWNQTQTAYPSDQCIHQLFEQQVERSPDAIALIFEEQTLTYQELNQQSNQLAHYLRSLGVQPNTLVGLCLTRSIDMVVGLLAIIKAGGAYVPLDTDYPTERLEYMMADAHLSVLLTHSEQLPRFEQPQIPVLCVDTLSLALSTQPTTALAVYGRATDLAYVIYTSGSTGQPKGVAICQQAIARLVLHTNYIALGPHSKIAQASNVSFDAATFEIWGALLNGGQLIGTRKETLLSPMALDAHLKRYQIDTLFITTALFNQLVSSVPTIFSHLDTVLFGGEAVDPFWVRTALAQGKPRHLLHVYGPTESTTFALWYPIVSVASDATTVPIGYPLSNTTAYVLDQNRQPVPVGVAGELYIGGDGLARGYLNRSALTSERFINCLCGENQKPQRLYKTGDLVRRLSDGAIEFLGRIDHQVKIRGFRIELGEVEAVLSRHPSVREAVAVVLAQPDTNNIQDKQLVAYVVTKSVITNNTDELTTNLSEQVTLSQSLRQFMQTQVPGYMVPSIIMIVEQLPLNANGKVERRALPQPDWAAYQLTQYEPPNNDMEKAIATAMAEVLGIKQVGRYDNFFDLGGHSLKATQVMSRLRQQLSLDLPLASLFDHPTPADLATIIIAQTVVESDEDLLAQLLAEAEVS